MNLAQAKITSLEAALKERESTIKIMADRMKASESARLSHLGSQYLTPTLPFVPTAPSSPATAPTSSPLPPATTSSPHPPLLIPPSSPHPPLTLLTLPWRPS